MYYAPAADVAATAVTAIKANQAHGIPRLSVVHQRVVIYVYV